MKSWQISPKYLRGDHDAIESRQNTLIKQLARVEERGRKLIEVIAQEGKPAASRCVNLLCVSSPEYLSRGRPDLWYGEHPRVLTWSELVALLRDGARFADLLAHA